MDEPVVLVGCDGTPDGDAALRFAVEEARLRGVRVVLAIAYFGPIDPDVDEFDTSRSELEARARNCAETALHRALHWPNPSQLPDYDIVAAEGDPVRVLLGHTAHAVMIVIGIHDRPLLQRLFARPVSRHLLHTAHIPVTIVPSEESPGR
jgi:nucleotide-binding universal stress UspA family protein